MMRFFGIVALLLSFSVQGVHGQVNPYYKVTPEGSTSESVRIVAAQSEYSACVHADWCNGDAAGCTLTTSRRVKLRPGFSPPISQVPTYVIMCTSTGSGQICTSGNPTVDMKIYGRDNSAGRDVTLTDREGKRVANPLPVDTSIDGVEWEDNSGPGSVRRFAFINFFDQAITQKDTDANSQKIGSQVFTVPSNTCRSITWPIPPVQSDPPRADCADPTANGCTDPYGIVFDNTTLEPVSGATVTLFRERDDKSYTLYDPCEKATCNLLNPQVVGFDGLYSMVVPPGTYRMEVAPPVMTDRAKLNSAAHRVYSDIYHGEPFVEEGTIVHLDIPVSADQNTIKAQKSHLMSYSYTIDRTTSTILLEGRTSHPLTTVSSYTYALAAGAKPSNLSPARDVSIDTQQADKGGVFQIKLPLASIPTGEAFGLLKLEKRQLIDLASAGRKTGLTTVSAEDASYISLPPIPEKIEGYLYDSRNQRLKNTRVDVLLPYAEVPYLSTTTDAAGFLQIPGKYLPTEPFELRSPDTQVVWTTTEFLAKNTELYEKSPHAFVRPLTVVGEESVIGGERTSSTQAQIRKQLERNGKQTTPKIPEQNQNQSIPSSSPNPLAGYWVVVMILGAVLIAGVGYLLWRAHRS